MGPKKSEKNYILLSVIGGGEGQRGFDKCQTFLRFPLYPDMYLD